MEPARKLGCGKTEEFPKNNVVILNHLSILVNELNATSSVFMSA